MSLILPSILLPFALRTAAGDRESENRGVQGLLWAQTHGTIAIGIGLALTGIGLVASLGSSMFTQAWLLLALTIYFVNLGSRSSSDRTCGGRRHPCRGRRQDLARPSAGATCPT